MNLRLLEREVRSVWRCKFGAIRGCWLRLKRGEGAGGGGGAFTGVGVEGGSG